MKKLTFLLFGLLLAVGWTSSVSAQALPQGGYAERLGLSNASTTGVYSIVDATKKMTSAQVTPMLPGADNSAVESPRIAAPKRVTGVSNVVKDKLYYQQFKYSWTDGATGETHTNVDPTEPATNPYQIYELLRFVYGNPNFPGPTYSAYLPNFNREDEVYYGAITGGWDITAGSGGATVNTHDIQITVGNVYASIASIIVYNADNNQELVNWNAAAQVNAGNYYSSATSGTTYYYFNLPTGWSSSNNFGMYNMGTSTSPSYVGYLTCGDNAGTLTIPYSVLGGATNVRVVINAATDEDQTSTIAVNGGNTESLTTTLTDYTWDNVVVAEQPEEDAFVQGTVVPPYEDGYTVLVVALNNDITIEPEGTYNSTYFSQKSQLIDYFQKNVEFVKLLTDGLRVGSVDDQTSGTIFNCDGRYNKFFFLGKGQARKKADYVKNRINGGYWQSYCGEDVPFKEMFEQFSPTSTALSESSQTLDFFDRLKEGNVYNLKHDCPSVIQTGHQFSLAGNSGTEFYSFSGLNFFIPDYRLLWWDGTGTDTSYPNVLVDGRDSDPYQRSDATTGAHGSNYRTPSSNNYYYWSAYYANYNPTHAPKVGIYKITLDATATQVGDSHDPDNENFRVTLTWVSSLDEMTGRTVPQIYTVYYWDPETGERKYVVAEGITDGKTGLTTVNYLVPQHEHSYVIEYIVMGTPNDEEHPAFVAWSNRDNVVIPGWNDFVGLVLDHHESDFIISEDSRDNYYRNFLAMVNEDIYNGLTISKISGYNEADPSTPLTPMNSFNLYRYEYNNGVASEAMEKIANITFDQPSAEKVHYKVTYEPGQQIEQYDVMEGNSVAIANAYQRSVMGIPDDGWVRVKGNGDIVIWPSSYFVNIKSITVKNGNTELTSWNANSANLTTDNANLPSSWIMSPGSKVTPFVTSSNEKVGYVEGGGYIAIPNLLNQYPNLTVEIVACNDGSHATTIAVNDEPQDVTGSSLSTYTWGTSSDPLSPNAAPKRAGRATSINLPIEVTDIFTSSNLGATSTQYATFSGKTLNSGAVIAGNTARSNSTYGNSIQMRSTNNSGIVTTTSGGKIKSIKIDVAGGTNTIDVYGKNTAYSSAADLYSGTGDNATRGYKMGSLTADGTITFTGDYQYFGIRSYNGAVYINSIEVTWETEETPAYDNLIDDWDYNVDGTAMPTGWTVTGGDATTATPQGWGDNGNSIYINPDGYITIPASVVGNYENIKVVVMYGTDISYTNSSSLNVSVNNNQGNNSQIAFNTYEWSDVDATNGITIKPNSGWVDIKSIRVYGDPAGEVPPTPTNGGLLRLHLLMVDQLKANIPDDNSHPDGYGYVLKYEPEGGEAKESGSVRVNIQKTDCEVMGYYTLDQIDRDTNRGLTMDVITADVEYDLSDENDLLDYYFLQGAEGALPTLNQNYLSKLQRQDDFTYREMYDESPNLGEVYPSGEHHYYNNTPLTGHYGKADEYVSYAPSVSTWGIERRYFEDDGLDNTYGGPIWKTSAGEVKMSTQKTPVAERQQNNTNSVNWTTADNKAASLYILDNIEAIGKLPHTALTKIQFEPYMFRVFVESENGKLRPYQVVEANPANTDQPGWHLEPKEGELTEADTHGPLCVWSGYIKFDENGHMTDDAANGVEVSTGVEEGQTTYIYHKNKVGRPAEPTIDPETGKPVYEPWTFGENNAIFGALDELVISGYDNNGQPIMTTSIDEKDLKVYVRFYFNVKGMAAGHTPWTRAGETGRPGNGSESDATSPSPFTAVQEIAYTGEVVSRTYVNALGMQSDQPFDGVNIVITRYSDGKVSTAKVVR